MAPGGRSSSSRLVAEQGAELDVTLTEWWGRVIHHGSCWLPTDDQGRTLDQALGELARPGSEACTARLRNPPPCPVLTGPVSPARPPRPPARSSVSSQVASFTSSDSVCR